VLVLLAFASLLSAALLFAVQPIAAKMALPLLGGSAAVWTTCMLFFQMGLLAGYGWADFLGRRFALRTQVILYGSFAAAALFTLPPAIASTAIPPVEASPAPWLLAALAVSFGIPYTTLAASGPLLQRWLSATNHPRASDPYFLYAASNAGSFLGLLAYPFVLERVLPLRGSVGGRSQAGVWSVGFVTLVLSVLASGIWATRRPGAVAVPVAEEGTTAAWTSAMHWALLAFVPSSTLLGVTQYLTTDIAAIPLLWIAPLALYLLTFVLAFSPRVRIPARTSGIALGAMAVAAAAEFQGSLRLPVILMIVVQLGALVAVGLFCHGRLAAKRPDRSQLTQFYLWIAAGGCLGGIFNAILAPQIFDSIAEYPIALGLAAFLVPDPMRDARTARGQLSGHAFDAATVLGIGALSLGLPRLLPVRASGSAWFVAVTVGVPCVLTLVFLPWPRRFAFALAALLTLSWMSYHAPWSAVHRDRTFYGIHRVVETDGPPRRHVLVDGVTRHGCQSLDLAERLIPTTYYHPSGPLGDIVRGMRERGGLAEVAIIGLGAGTTAAYGQSGELFSYFEIDPAVARLARDPALFTYLTDSRARVEIVLGDGRRRLAECGDGRFDLIVLDAFSSDAIPVHLLTREAVASYLRKLRPGGCLALHLTNGYVNLPPVVAAIAADLGVPAAVKVDTNKTPQQAYEGKDGSTWAIMAREAGAPLPIEDADGWFQTRAENGARPNPFLWTDERSNLVDLLMRGRSR
jgi:SAM-dependent methyltransferase